MRSKLIELLNAIEHQMGTFGSPENIDRCPGDHLMFAHILSTLYLADETAKLNIQVKRLSVIMESVLAEIKKGIKIKLW